MLKTALRASLLLAFAFTLPACDSTEDDPAGTPPAVDPTGAFTAAAANSGQWTFIPTGGAKCRDGSDTGFGVRLQEGATNLMVYLEGGGACFNSDTCSPLANRSSFGAADFTARIAGGTQLNPTSLSEGIFSTDASNPVGDWNAVYVPYCTGDVHGGSAPDAQVLGVEGTQQFVGHRNIEAYLGLLGPYFGDPNKVLLTGASAGGFGSLLNFPVVDATFNDSQTYLLDDSGPIFYADNVLSPGLGLGFIGLYNFAGTLPGAGTVVTPDGDGLQNIYSYLATSYPDSRFALASHLEDNIIRFFFGFGQPDQTITGDEYAAGLIDVRDRLPSEWGTYFAAGGDHTFIGVGSRYTGTSGGVALNTYVGALVNGNVSDVGPAPVRPAAQPLVLAAR